MSTARLLDETEALRLLQANRRLRGENERLRRYVDELRAELTRRTTVTVDGPSIVGIAGQPRPVRPCSVCGNPTVRDSGICIVCANRGTS